MAINVERRPAKLFAYGVFLSIVILLFVYFFLFVRRVGEQMAYGSKVVPVLVGYHQSFEQMDTLIGWLYDDFGRGVCNPNWANTLWIEESAKLSLLNDEMRSLIPPTDLQFAHTKFVIAADSLDQFRGKFGLASHCFHSGEYIGLAEDLLETVRRNVRSGTELFNSKQQ